MWLSFKFEDDIDDFFLPTYAVNNTLRLSDLVDPSSFLFLILTLSEIEFEIRTLLSVAPDFFKLDENSQQVF